MFDRPHLKLLLHEASKKRKQPRQQASGLHLIPQYAARPTKKMRQLQPIQEKQGFKPLVSLENTPSLAAASKVNEPSPSLVRKVDDPSVSQFAKSFTSFSKPPSSLTIFRFSSFSAKWQSALATFCLTSSRSCSRRWTKGGKPRPSRNRSWFSSDPAHNALTAPAAISSR